MKKKIIFRYLITIIITALIVFFINLAFLYNFVIHDNINPNNALSFKGVDNFVRDFEKNIEFKNGLPMVTSNGLKEIEKRKGWIQILDEDGNEVYKKDKPQNVPSKYAPVDIIHAHRYTGGIKGSTIFVSSVKDKDYKWSYVIGFPEELLMKYTVYFNKSEISNISILVANFMKIFMIIILITIVVTSGIGYLFVRKLTKPLFSVVDEIKILAEGNYNHKFTNKGIYKEINSWLNKLSYNLSENERIREEWIENISHDLKTPLSSIKGYTEILEDDTYDLTQDEKNKYLKIIKEKSNYMEKLLKDLRLTYQLKNDQNILKREKVNIVDLMTDTIIDILNHPKYENREINLRADEHNLFCTLDIKLFKRAINNLIYNSLIHNDEKVVIDVVIYQKDKIYIEIKDNGSGMSQETLENLFKRYYRGTNTEKDHKGSGLGMAISKSIIENHKGDIEVTSIKGVGTTFKISI